MSKTRLAFVLGLTSFIAAPSLCAQVATPAMIGRWRGEAVITVNWTRQRTLPVEIVIYARDSVTGTVGDAALVNGRIRLNRGEPVIALASKTTYVIDGNLDGPVIRAEGVWRSSVAMQLDWIDGRFEGGLATSGYRAGSTERRVLVAKLTLRRAPDMVVCTTRTTCEPTAR